MSEAQISVVPEKIQTADAVIPSSDLATRQLGAGALLKQAREASGLHIAALAILLKVPVKKLEALESEQFDVLPDAVFVRALASSVCRTLKVDPAIVLAQLPQTYAPKLTYQGAGINAPFRSPSDGPGPSVWAQVSRPTVLAGLLLLMGAVVLIFLPTITTGISELSQVTSNFKTKYFEAEKTMPVTEAMAGAPLAAESSVPATVSSSLPVSSAKVSSEAQFLPTFAVTAISPQASDVVVFTAKTQTWVEAIDATDQVLIRRTLTAGEVVGASGKLPLKVVVGRANAVQVEIRGKVFDVNALAKDNVARFEVK